MKKWDKKVIVCCLIDEEECCIGPSCSLFKKCWRLTYLYMIDLTVKLNKDINYIVSGLERSGTSLMMQILEASGIPVVYDDSRKPDKNNPKGYFELEGGKIIDKLKDGTFPMEKYKGKFIKITSWGLQYLPEGRYDIIYMVRNIDEIIKSTENMSKKKMTELEKDEMRNGLVAFDRKCLKELEIRSKMGASLYVPVFYNALVNPTSVEDELSVLAYRYGNWNIVSKGKEVVDKKLYRCKSGD